MRRIWTRLLTERLPNSRTRAILPLTLFAAVQVAYGVMTLAGVQRFGPAVEGNPVLLLAIGSLGPGAALVAAKSVALLLAIALHLRSQHATVAALTVIYVFGAICPWSIALATF